MDLLERYLYQVRKFLPIKERNDVIKELRSLILDQLEAYPESDQEYKLNEILIEMGTPRDTARKYREDRPLLSREMEPVIEFIIKIMVITFPLVFLFAQLIGFLTANDSYTTMDLLLHLVYQIPTIISALLSAIGIVFLIFVLVERYINPKFELPVEHFNPKSLPDIPTKDFKVNIVGVIIEMLITVLFLYLINYQEGLIAVYYDGNSEPLLNANFQKILPLLNIGLFITIVVNIYYVFARRKNLISKTVELFQGIYNGVVMIFLATSDIFNEVIIDGYNLEIVPNIIRYVFIFIGVLTIFGSTVEYLTMFIHLYYKDPNKKES